MCMRAFAALTLQGMHELYIMMVSVRRAARAGNTDVCTYLWPSRRFPWCHLALCGGGWLRGAQKLKTAWDCHMPPSEGSKVGTPGLWRTICINGVELQKYWKLCYLPSKQWELQHTLGHRSACWSWGQPQVWMGGTEPGRCWCPYPAPRPSADGCLSRPHQPQRICTELERHLYSGCAWKCCRG